jgi:hypothetical protein
MLQSDEETAGRETLGRWLVRLGLAAIVAGLVAGAVVAFVPTEGSTQTQSLIQGAACCAGPRVVSGVPSILVGRMMMRREKPQDDAGSLYRGGR